MDKIYSDLDNPAGLGSIKKLYDEMRKRNSKITKEDVKKFLKKQHSYTLTKVTKNKFPRRKFLFPFPGHTLVADVAYVKYYPTNKPYLLVLLDGYSRYAFVFELASLKSTDVRDALKRFFDDTTHSWKRLLSDDGVEFKNKLVMNLLKTHGVIRYSTLQREIKASIAERFIKTLKDKISRFVIHFNTEEFSKKLQKIVNTYNLTPHRSLMFKSPTDVFLLTDWHDIKTFSVLLYKKHLVKGRSVSKALSTGTVVRIKNWRGSFTRTYHLQNSRELFRVDSVNFHHVPITYNLKDLEGKKILGIFYKEELTEVDDSGLYEIKVLKTRKRKGKVEYLVKYVHFPDSKAEWIQSKMIERIRR